MKRLKIITLSLLVASAPMQADPSGGYLFGFLMTVIAVAKGEMLKKPINWAIGKGTKIIAAIPPNLKPTPRDLIIGAGVATPTISTAVYEGHQAHKVLAQNTVLKATNQTLTNDLATATAQIAIMQKGHEATIGYKINEKLSYLNANPFYAALTAIGAAGMLYLTYKSLQWFFTPSRAFNSASKLDAPTVAQPAATHFNIDNFHIYVDGKRGKKNLDELDCEKSGILAEESENSAAAA